MEDNIINCLLMQLFILFVSDIASQNLSQMRLVDDYLIIYLMKAPSNLIKIYYYIISRYFNIHKI